MYSAQIDTAVKRHIQSDPVLCRFLQQSAVYLGLDVQAASGPSAKVGYSQGRTLPAEAVGLRH
jgi:hypothetical protein